MNYIVNNENCKIWNPNRETTVEKCYTVYLGITKTGSPFQATRYPTDNCQWASIGSANNIINSSNALLIFKDINIALNGRPMFLLDLKRTYENRVEELFSKTDIVMKTQYKSTNDSEMTLYLVKTTAFD